MLVPTIIIGIYFAIRFPSLYTIAFLGISFTGVAVTQPIFWLLAELYVISREVVKNSRNRSQGYNQKQWNCGAPFEIWIGNNFTITQKCFSLKLYGLIVVECLINLLLTF